MATSQLLPRAQPQETTPERRDPLLVRVAPELVGLALVAVLWPATTGLESSAGGPGPAFFPQVLLVLLTLASLIGLVVEVRRSRAGSSRARVASAAAEAPVTDVGPDEDETHLPRALQAAALVLAYVAATAVMGWVLASTAFALVFLVLSGHRRPLPVLAVALVAPQVLAYLFVKVVYIALPTGVGLFDTVTVALYRLFGVY